MTTFSLAIAVKGEWDANRLLHDLRSAGADPSSEIHVACDPEHAPATVPQGLNVHVKANASLFDLWGLAIAQSRSEWVAILHADALPGPGWFSAIQRAIDTEGWKDGYWGPVEPRFGPSDRRMISYLTEYCQFHRPLDPSLKEIPGSNLILPRKRIEATEDFSKTRLLQQGLAPRLVEDAVALYARPFRFRDYRGRRFRHGRAFAAARTPRLSVTAAVPLTAALPFVRCARIVRHAWRHKDLRRASVRWLPAILAAETCWSAGELTGYVTRRLGDASALD
ncbi:MAG: hypothetical protein ABI454_06395 [Sphingomicrobium sp.]